MWGPGEIGGFYRRKAWIFAVFNGLLFICYEQTNLNMSEALTSAQQINARLLIIAD